MNDRRKRALEFAAEKHDGQIRLDGVPYITHPVAVARMLEERGCGEDCVITALFHDLLEDTDATEEEIEAIGGKRVLEAVKRLTKRRGCAMADYIAGIKADPLAFAVKGADRLHNLCSAVLADEAFRRAYLLETESWYLDFAPEIPAAARALAETLKKPAAQQMP